MQGRPDLHFSKSFIKKRVLFLLFRIFIASAITFGLIQFKLDYLEAAFFDLRTRLRPNLHQSGNIEIILIDADTISAFKKVPGFKEHSDLLRMLLANKPKSIIYTRQFAPLKTKGTPFNKDDQSAYFSGTENEQKEFVKYASLFQNFIVQTDSMERAVEKNTLTLIPPFESIRLGSGPKTVDRNILARDGVSRRILISYQGQELLHFKVATLFNPTLKNIDQVRGAFDLFDSKQAYVNYIPQNKFSITKFHDVLNGKVDPVRFTGKLVLIGDDIGASSKDYAATPFDREENTTVTELHANMFDTLIRNDSPVPLPIWIDGLFTFIVSILTLFVTLNLRPLKGLLILLGAAASYAVIAWILFTAVNVWIQMAHPLVAIFVCYYFFIPYRLIIENRKSWEFFQKHKLLEQVEELKTNFISMMSHDLKTPIARIQGMTEIITKDPVQLSAHQHEAVDTIKASATDLLHFMNSILNYARIESQGVVLHKQAKDINELLQEVIKRHEFLAKVKHIKILSELEPLFSISIDPDLIRQVFSNLLENAIKYSPENSKVTVKSKEEADFVSVDFIDEGPGIPPEELPHLFLKFFRSKSVKNTNIKGFGLGLYLAKYFTELHKGHIIITAPPGKSATFTVKLPLKAN